LLILHSPNGFFSDSKQSSGTGQDEYKKSKENMKGHVSSSKVGSKPWEQEGDQASKPLKKN
jgi:hypothetical protein